MFKTILGAATVIAIAALPALADGDAEKGEKVFKKCKACHDVGEGAKNKVGPELNDVMGRTAGTVPDFSYSDAMVEAGAGGLVWNEETLEEYLKNPKDFIPGNKMSFAGLRKDDEIDNVIAYLETFNQ